MITFKQSAKFRRLSLRKKKRSLQKMLTIWIIKALETQGLMIDHQVRGKQVPFATATIEDGIVKIKFEDEQ